MIGVRAFSSSLVLGVCLCVAAACDDGGDDVADDTEADAAGGKADSLVAKSWVGADRYDIDRFDDDNAGRTCGFERHRQGAISDGTQTITLNAVFYPLTTRTKGADGEPIRLTRKDPDRSLFELPVFEAVIDDDADDGVAITVFINRLTLDPEIMVVRHADGQVQVCADLEAE